VLDVDAVLLDSGGVLLLPDPDAMRAAVAPFGAVPDDDACHRAHYAGTAAVDRLGRGDWRAADLLVAKALGVADDRLGDAVEAITWIYDEGPWVPIDGAVHALRALQDKGFRLAVVSNASGTMERMLADHRICAVGGGEAVDVTIVIDSHVVGVEKPDPRIFELALDALGLPAERCVHVGDSVHFDVEGAHGAGLHGVHVDPYDMCDRDDHPHVASVADLAGRLGAA
jgi:putative hydrolase of the HAD superfamily